MLEHSPPSPAAVTREMSAELWKSATGVLDANWAKGHMVSSGHVPPHQWSQDAAFIAVGLAYVNPTRAWQDLRNLFDAQWPDGRVPHVVFSADLTQRPATAGECVPGPEFWQVPAYGSRPARGSSGLVQPPLHAFAAWEVYRRSASHGAACAHQASAELAWLYPRLVAQHTYLSTARDADGTGLASIVHPWESGMDDSPAWAAALAGVPAGRYDRRTAGATDLHDARLRGLALAYRDAGYGDTDLLDRHPFVVQCPSFNAMLACAESALARIAEVVGADAAAHRARAQEITTALVDTLWDPRTRTFRARDVRSGMLSPARTIGGLVPLILPGLPAEHAAAIMAEAGSPRFGLPGLTGLPLPSYDRTAGDFDARRCWRGPVQLDANWLLRRGMLAHGFHGEAETLRGAMLRLVHRAGHFASYHPDTGEGIGAPGASGTAALALDLLADRSVPAYAHAA